MPKTISGAPLVYVTSLLVTAEKTVVDMYFFSVENGISFFVLDASLRRR